MITKEQLMERHNLRIKEVQKPNSRYECIPHSMFINEEWNHRNWNGGDGIIRQWTHWLEYEGNRKIYCEFDYLGYGYQMVANWDYYEDQTYVTIVLHKYRHDPETDEEANWTFDQYLITYYKNRGKTDAILLNGKQVNFDEYVELLNIIEASGFKFNMQN